MFAVIKTGGKQYRVSPSQLLKVEKVAGNAGEVVEFKEVLIVGEGDKTTIGTPVIADALVTAEVVEQARAPKVIAFKKRRRQNSKRIRGHRQELTIVRISEILTGGAKPKKAAAKPVEAAKPAEKAVKPAEKAAKPAAAKAAAPKAEKPAAKKVKTETADKKAAPKKAAAKKSEK